MRAEERKKKGKRPRKMLPRHSAGRACSTGRVWNKMQTHRFEKVLVAEPFLDHPDKSLSDNDCLQLQHGRGEAAKKAESRAVKQQSNRKQGA